MLHQSKLPRLFLFAAGVWLVIGVGLGLYMGASANFALAPVHGHINLIGWASLALFGLTYQAFPRAVSARFGQIHFLLSVAAAIFFPFGLWLELYQGEPRLIALASLLWLAAALQYALLAGKLVFRRGSSDPGAAP